MSKPYDYLNVFARILRREIAIRCVHESAHTLAFMDAKPQAKIHMIVIPKGPYKDMSDFLTRASPSEFTDFFMSVKAILSPEGNFASGARVVSNMGEFAGQTVGHFHLHILGGENLGPMTQNDTTLFLSQKP